MDPTPTPTPTPQSWLSPHPESSMLRYYNKRSRKSEILSRSPHRRQLEDGAAEKKPKTFTKKKVKINPRSQELSQTLYMSRLPIEPIVEDWIKCIFCRDCWLEKCTDYATQVVMATNVMFSCDYRCGGVDNATKSSLPVRCPYVKSYPVDSCRHYSVEPSSRMHPMTIREWESLRDAACFWKDKYDRLYENQRRLQKINESLEEKLLHAAEKFENEKSDLTRDVSDLTARLVEARLTIAELEEENEQYRNDCNIAVRLLQCKPSSFVAHKFNSMKATVGIKYMEVTIDEEYYNPENINEDEYNERFILSDKEDQLPADFQAKVKRHLARPAKDNRASSLLLNQCPPDVRTIKVSVPTLPSANMVYSVNKSSAGMAISTQSSTAVPNIEETTPDHISAAIIAKVLEERSLERKAISSSKKQKIAEENRDSVVRNVAIQTDYQRPVLCRCQFVPKTRSMQSDGDGIRIPKDSIMSNSTETAI